MHGGSVVTTAILLLQYCILYMLRPVMTAIIPSHDIQNSAVNDNDLHTLVTIMRTS